MKRFLSACLTAVMLLALAVPVSADLLWEPRSNAFYSMHRDDCEYLGRNYRANSPDGFVTVWNAPNGSMVVDQFSNGFQMWAYWQYENWGLVSIRGDEEWIEGWVDLEQMDLIYDNASFAEEYAHRIAPYNGEFADFTDAGAVINFYSYPGSPDIVRSNFMFEYDTMEMLVGTKDSPSYIQSVFVDEQGLTWGFVGYMRGRLNAWFCLDDPSIVVGEGVPLRDVGAEDPIPAQPPTLPAKAYLPYALVGGVAALTAGMLAFFRKKKK